MALWNPLRRLLDGSPPAPAGAGTTAPSPARSPAPSTAMPAAAPAAPAGPAAGERELELRFTAWLLASPAPAEGPPTAAEAALLQRLAALAAQGLDAELVPRLPAVLPRLIALSRREDSSPRELAALLARDPALVGAVVQLANSPRYRVAREIAELQDALAVLGQLGLSQLVTRVAMRPILGLAQGRFGRAAGAWLWELSERGAHAAAALRQGQADAFAAYLAGTVAPVGLMAALRVLDQQAPQDEALPGAPSAAFLLGLWQQAARLSVQAARQWDFPAEVLQALQARADGSPAVDPLDRALLAADRAARRQLLAQAGVAPAAGAASAEEAQALTELERRFGAPMETT